MWDFSSGIHGKFIFYRLNQFVGEIFSSSQIEETPEKKVGHLYHNTRHLFQWTTINST